MSDEEDQFDEEVEDILEEEESKGFAGFVKAYSPMFLLSVAMHLVLLLIISLMPTEPTVTEQQVTVITQIEEEEPVEEIEEIEKIELETTEIEVEPVENTEPVEEEVVEVEDEPMETLDDNMEEVVDLIPDEVSNVQDLSNLAVMGLSGGASGASGLPSGYGNRSGKGKKNALRRGGGGGRTEKAVDAALKWLAEHQEADGSWVPLNNEGKNKANGAATAVALLPFLGAGHNESSGKYRETVRRGVNYLNNALDKVDFNKKSEYKDVVHNNYGGALALMALAETSMFGSSSATTANGERLAEHFIKQYMEKPGEGWHYFSPGDDLSVSGWIALGLKSAKGADFRAMHSKDAHKVLDDYKEWVDKTMTDPVSGYGQYKPGRKFKGNHKESMMLVGMFQKQFLGFPLNDKFLLKASENTLDIIKTQKLIGGPTPGDSYEIYYGTLSAFQQQGPLWYAWNPAMIKTLVGSQRKGSPKEFGGSWDPTPSHVCRSGGRIYTTALFALCLEVYYRYEMMN